MCLNRTPCVKLPSVRKSSRTGIPVEKCEGKNLKCVVLCECQIARKQLRVSAAESHSRVRPVIVRQPGVERCRLPDDNDPPFRNVRQGWPETASASVRTLMDGVTLSRRTASENGPSGEICRFANVSRKSSFHVMKEPSPFHWVGILNGLLGTAKAGPCSLLCVMHNSVRMGGQFRFTGNRSLFRVFSFPTCGEGCLVGYSSLSKNR